MVKCRGVLDRYATSVKPQRHERAVQYTLSHIEQDCMIPWGLLVRPRRDQNPAAVQYTLSYIEQSDEVMLQRSQGAWCQK
jgi:hypothetical protein